ncbi:MAG: TetR family transcriptional regulator, partial [Actinophytocola sp.]|nr:TetR family transcriptional regulator [Actinophytocola sp.]
MTRLLHKPQGHISRGLFRREDANGSSETLTLPHGRTSILRPRVDPTGTGRQCISVSQICGDELARARVTDDAALIKAAASVFRAKGYRGTTISDIADAAGISRPTLYSYAGSKQWLLDRIIQRLLDDISALLADDYRAGDTPWQRLDAVVARHVTSAVENGGFYAILLSEESELSPEMRENYRVVVQRNTSTFRRCNWSGLRRGWLIFACCLLIMVWCLPVD